MLLAQTSPHCQLHLSVRTRIDPSSLKAFHLSHFQGLSRLLPTICIKRTLQSFKWSWGSLPFQCIRKSDLGIIQMRFVDAVLSMDLENKCCTSKAVDRHTAVLTNSFNQASLSIGKASAGGPLSGRSDFEEAQEKRRRELESLRRKRISEAKKGRAPWNKGLKGVHRKREEGSTPQSKEVAEPISQEERENLRRQRISKSNRGRVPWNKGGKHSPETKDRIRESVLERMKDPKIREKLRLQAEAVKLSPEIRLKIRIGVINAWNEKRKIKAIQEGCLTEWQEMVAEVARVGCEGDAVYEWGSYSTIKEKLRLTWQRPLKRKAPSRAHRHSMDHRMKISAAIKAKWSDPDYRVSVQEGIREFKMNQRTLSSPLVTKPKISREPVRGHTVRYPKNRACNVAAGQKIPLKLNLLEPVFIKRNLDLSPYKDPETEKKLEKLMSMRVRRINAEAQKQKDITERARVLIVQAGEAAKALEAAAVKDKNALAPLLETRRLLAEAVSSLESMKWSKLNRECLKDEEGSSLYAHALGVGDAGCGLKGEGENRLELESTHFSSAEKSFHK